MERRQFISVSSMSFLLSGCMGVTLNGSNESDSPAVNAAGSTTPDSATGTGTPKQPHDLYVMNYTTTTKTVTVSVLDENKNTIIGGQYEIPSERGIEFEDVGAWQKTYEIKLSIGNTELYLLCGRQLAVLRLRRHHRALETAMCDFAEPIPMDSKRRSLWTAVTRLLAQDTPLAPHKDFGLRSERKDINTPRRIAHVYKPLICECQSLRFQNYP